MTKARTILIVDDVAMFRELGALFLARSGSVITARSGEEGLEIAQREKPALVITDLHMPDMDGAALCSAIKGDPAIGSTPVVVMMGGDEAADRGRAVRAGADDLLSKPLSRLALVEAVSRFVRHDSVRGLPRIDVCEPVQLTSREETCWGTVRNLSRGGLFVETDLELSRDTEVNLHFALPETCREIDPSAQVVWHKPGDGSPSGLGLRFLEVEGHVTRWLENFVWEHRSAVAATGASAAGAKA